MLHNTGPGELARLMGGKAVVRGRCDPRFAGVGEALAENMSERGELGAAVAVVAEGRPVVDLWCGWVDEARREPWREGTLVNVFSVGKAFAAVCVLMLVSRGEVELDEPICRRWREFASTGKESITLRELLSHRAGLAAIDAPLPDGALYEWETVTSALAAQAPCWPPGSAHGYHVHTFGFLLGEIVRRVTGEPIGVFLERELAGRLAVELSFGLALGRRQRRSPYFYDPGMQAGVEAMENAPGPAGLRIRAYMNPRGATGLGTVNTSAWMDAEVPSANLHANARGIARAYAALIDPQLCPVDPAVLGEARKEASVGMDLVLERPSRFGLGFQLTQPERPLGPGPSGFGHFGAGGSLGFADPQAGIAFAYVMNSGGAQWQDPRNRALINATYQALA